MMMQHVLYSVESLKLFSVQSGKVAALVDYLNKQYA